MSDKERMIQAKQGGFLVKKSPQLVELEQIKQRQKERKQKGLPKNVTLEYVAQMLSDVLENQARTENILRELRHK